jgi:hypothetical protein
MGKRKWRRRTGNRPAASVSPQTPALQGPTTPAAPSPASEELMLAPLTNGSKSFARHFLDRAFDLAEEVFKHHMRLASLGIGALLVLAFVFAVIFVIRHRNGCFSIEGHYTGEIKICDEQSKAEESSALDGLHGNVYTDLQAGYSLTLPDPDGWSVFPATDFLDPQNGQIAKRFSFPTGALGRIPVQVVTDYGLTAFISRPKINFAPVTMWVHRLPTENRTVEQFIQLETGSFQMRMTGAAVAAYATGLFLAGITPKPTSNKTPPGTVTLSAQVVSPDHRSALLLWIAPYLGLDADIVGRFVLGPTYAYYIVAIRPKPADRDQEKFNADVRTMIESFRLLDTSPLRSK